MRTVIRPGTIQPPQQSPASPAPVSSPSTGLIATTGTAAQHPVAGSSQQAQPQQLHSSTGHTAQATTPPSTSGDLPNPLPPPTNGHWNAEWIPLGSIVANHNGNRMSLEAQRCPYCYFLRYITPDGDDRSNAARTRHTTRSHVRKQGDNSYSKAQKHSRPDRYTYVGTDKHNVMTYQCKRCRRRMQREDTRTHSC